MSAGFHGDGTGAANGLFDNPQGIAADSNGNLYIADSGNARIRVIYPSHILNTAAGYGRYAGDNGPALSAVLTNPGFVALDNMGDLLISDQDNHVVRMVDLTGTITTIAGSGIPGNAGDGGPATSAQLNSPQGLAVDSLGNVYVADAVNATVRMITPDGAIFRIAGGGTILNDGGPALKAKLNSPHGIALDGQGNIYIADSSNNRVRIITTDASIHTFLGDGVAQDVGDGGPASLAGVNKPWDVKVTGNGTVYVSEFSGGRVRSVSPAGIASTTGFSERKQHRHRHRHRYRHHRGRRQPGLLAHSRRCQYAHRRRSLGRVCGRWRYRAECADEIAGGGRHRFRREHLRCRSSQQSRSQNESRCSVETGFLEREQSKRTGERRFCRLPWRCK